METIVASVLEIIKSLWVPVKSYVSYTRHFRENVEELSEKVEDLEARRKYLEEAVSYIQDEEQINEVRRWIERAIKMEKLGRKIEQEAKEKKKCQYLASKQAKKEADIIAQLRQAGEFERMSFPSLTPVVIPESAPSIKGLSSVESTLKRVMAALGDENNRIIGVWGMGGVGKTTVVKNLNNQLMGTQHFSKVIVVIVSKDVDINRVQDDIASRLGLTFHNGSSRASQLNNRLKREKFLLILDDVWEKLDLNAVGVPSGDNLLVSKIILTTRKRNVCHKMETQTDVEVDVLRNDEAKKLFTEKAGDVFGDPALHEIAVNVLLECGGLPLAVITVGTALKGKTEFQVWENALVQLREAAPVDIEDMEDKVYKPIRLSYELLREELKPGFLFCCLYPDDYDIEIDRMIKQWMGEGILEDAGDLDITINRGHSWVAELKASCLLLDGRVEGSVRMHDVVRDVGIYIASKHNDYKSVVRTAVGFHRLPRVQWEAYKRISVMRSRIKELQDTAPSHHSLTLMLQENEELERIDGFLQGRKMLRVLDLSSTRISPVPKPISKMDSLRVLCLRNCRSINWDLSPLRSLKRIEFLDFSDNKELRELPTVIGELTSVRSLNLTRTPHLILKKGILSGLTQLEELKMLESFNQWGGEEGGEVGSTSSGTASLAELVGLENLSRLFLDCVDEDWSPESSWLMHSSGLRNLKKFRIRLIQTRLAENSLPLAAAGSRHSGKSMDIIGHTFFAGFASVMLERTAGLTLINCRFSWIFLTGEFRTLECLSLHKCNDTQYVFKEYSSACLDNLLCLELQDLPDLKEVSSEGDERPLRNLTDVQVSQCGKLAYLFPAGSLRTMKNLTSVKVDYCRGMTNVFLAPSGALESGNGNSGMLQNLQTLILSHLPSLESVFPKGQAVSVQKLTNLSVTSCGGFGRSVLSRKELKDGLPNLAELSVVDCTQVEVVISDVGDKEALLPRLRKLKLHGLPKLRSICERKGGDHHQNAGLGADWQSLEEILVRSCPRLKKLEPLRRGPAGVPSLGKIEVERQWWDGLDWGADNTGSKFQPLFIQIRN
ncbi:hypothetical protein ACLOJK_031505 [Asimina triloba]